MGAEENEPIKDVQPVQIETNGENGDQEEENGEANNEDFHLPGVQNEFENVLTIMENGHT